MDRLSGLDAMFLYLETASTPMHIAGLAICEPPKGYHGHPFEEFKAQVISRLHEIPSFSRVLHNQPLRLDHPVWVTADSIDLDYHFRKAALPKPGNRKQLMTMVEHLHTQLLDRKRPLWQYHVIEGLEDGRFALYMKTHHACLDGGGGVMALDIVSDREPKPREPYPKPDVRFQTRKPGFFEMLGHAFGSVIQQQVEMVAATPKAIRAIRNVVRSAIKDRTWDLNAIKPAPRTIFNGRVGRRRAFGTASLPVSEFKLMGKAAGATLNDIVLTICAGGLRRYLSERNQMPEDSLVAAVPVSMREVGDTSMANQVASIFPRIGSHIADPLERLKYVAESTKRAKSQMSDVREIVPRDFSMFGAPAIAPLVWQIVERTSVTDIVPPMMNVAISNVPGSRRPMYFAGIEVKEFYPVSIATHGVGLNITVQSYVDRLDFGLTTCRDICPDVQKLTDMIVDEFNDLKAKLIAQAIKAEREKPKPANDVKAKASRAKPKKKVAKPKLVEETQPAQLNGATPNQAAE
jgi:diacylglycerol O-acyltransferase / wax synthase